MMRDNFQKEINSSMAIKSKLKKALALGVSLCFMVPAMTGCNNEPVRYYDNEEDSLRFSTLEVDKVFNPFFSTSGTDSNVVGLTQMGMLSNNSEGEPTYGDEAPTAIVEDMEIVTTYKGEGENKEPDKTTYYFVLRNNVKFSNGTPLTIKDVLFNFYVYLDVAYTGASTIYSTDIVGLKEYRTQASTEKEQDEFMSQFQVAATARLDALAETAEEIFDENENTDFSSDEFVEKLEEKQAEKNNSAYDHIVEDYEKAEELFKQELENDYSNSMNTYEDFLLTDKDGKEYRGLFTTDVEMFLYNEGYITWNKKDGKLENGIVAENQIETLKNWTKEQAINHVYEDKIPYDISDIIQFWATAEELNTYVVNAEMENHFKTHPRQYTNISGIKFANGGEARLGADSVTVNGKSYATPVYREAGKPESGIVSGNEVLSIQINGVDPKAVWNFGIGVAPMYYYSDQAHIDAFDFKANFGVEYGSQTFMNNVVKNPDKIGVPVGAGPYRASRSSGLTSDTDLPASGEFYDNGTIYFERNNNYIEPVTIKKVRFRVVASNQMLNNLYTGDVDFAEPNAKPETTADLKKNEDKGIGYENVMTSGYGYIGINAGKVPDLAVRQAIMYCINTDLIVGYYQTDAKAIYRSMSRASWAYPKDDTGEIPYYPFIGNPVPSNLDVVDPQYKTFVQGLGKKAGDTLTEAQQENFIRYLVEEVAGYHPDGKGIYSKNGTQLKYTFTIAGESNDHPAWLALYNAGTRLNKYGFSINVTPDANALKKLSSGDLTVWAAAWGSTIDPDMYQVYHKDSSASSVKNWGYPQIIRNAGNKYSTENDILTKLSDNIEKARKTIVQSEREFFYNQALTQVMQLAVELPTYQRDDLFAYNERKIDTGTFTPENDLSPFKGLTSDLHTISLVTNKES